MAKILIIEDDQGILDATKMALEFEGYTVKTAEEGTHADELMNGTLPLPDVIVLDILLSGLDGRMICKKLKGHARTKHIPVLMMSAHPSAEKSVRAAQADAFLAKPFNIDDLLEALKRLIPKA